MMRSDTMDDPNYNFTSPYPKPQFEYPTSHSRISLPGNGTRSPSPSPSEIEESKQAFIPRKFLTADFYKRPKVILWMTVFIIIAIFSVLITVYHQQIENWLRPAANWMQRLKFGFLIPIAILFIISFPPLFGHEIVAVLCGNVWGLWEGFGIVCAGTLLGEIGNFYAFKYLCSSRGDKLERESFFYGCLARAVREGGFFVAVMARLSVIPGHFTTAVFATCGMNIFVFILAAILSLPKQFVTVYLGVLLEQSAGNTSSTKHQKLVSDLVVVASILVTSVAMWYIIRKMNAQRLQVVRDRRRRLQGSAGLKQYEEGRIPLTGSRHNGSSSSLVSDEAFNPGISDAELVGPRMAVNYDDDRGRSVPQRWNERGHAIETSDDSYNDPYSYNAYPPPRQTPQNTSPALAPKSIPAPAQPSFSVAAPSQSVPIPYAPPASTPTHLRAGVDPYDGIAHPLPQQPTFAPPAGPPPIVQQLQTSPLPVPGTISIPPPPTAQSASAAATSTVPSSSYTTAQQAPSISVSQHESEMPQSPFEDKYAVRIPSHVKRYQLSDGDGAFRASQTNESTERGGDVRGGESGDEILHGGGRHYQETTGTTFYSAHSRGATDASDVDLR